MQPYQEKEGLLHVEVYKGEFSDQVITIEKFFSQDFRRIVTPETWNHGDRGGHPRAGPELNPCLNIPHNNMQVTLPTAHLLAFLIAQTN